MSPNPRFMKQDQTLSYKIIRYPTTSMKGGYSLLSPAQVDQVIQMAFDRWSQISNFKFAQVTDGTDLDIKLTFDSFANALLPETVKQVDKLGVVAATQSQHSAGSDFVNRPVVVCFDDSYVWTTLANNPATPYHAILWAVKAFVEIFTAYDLLTAATHEFGHVLGLDHSSSFNSVMQATLVAQSATTRYYLDPRPLHEVDCAALAARYDLSVRMACQRLLKPSTATIDLHAFEPGKNTVAIAGYEMSGQWGADASQGNVAVVGRFTNYSDVNHQDCDFLVYLVVSRAGENPKAAVFTEAWTEIANAGSNPASKYVARQWGMSVAGARPLLLATARTYPDSPPTGGGFNYDNAMGYFYLSALL